MKLSPWEGKAAHVLTEENSCRLARSMNEIGIRCEVERGECDRWVKARVNQLIVNAFIVVLTFAALITSYVRLCLGHQIFSNI